MDSADPTALGKPPHSGLGLTTGAYAPPLSPPITPYSPCTSLPSMSAVHPSRGVPPDASPFEAYILDLLSRISQLPSPAYPFPAPAQEGQANTKPGAYNGDKTDAQAAIEQAVLALEERLRKAEQGKSAVGTSGATGQSAAASLPTPDWTPPASETDPAGGFCQTCARPFASQGPPSSLSHPMLTTALASHPLSASLSTPASHISSMRQGMQSTHAPHSILTTASGASVLTGGPAAAGWPQRGSISESGMSAEKELELLKAQVQDIARVCKVSQASIRPRDFTQNADDQAVATGDLTQKIIVPVEGQAMTELKDIINSMVDRLKTFAVEVERVSLEVGTEGKLGGQAIVEGVEGTWKELTNVVNKLAANLTNQVRSIAKVTKVSVDSNRQLSGAVLSAHP